MTNKGISAIIVSLIILAVSMGMAVAYASTMMGWFGSASAIIKTDTSDTKIILNPNTGYTKTQIVIKNLGTTTLKIDRIELDTKTDDKAEIKFDQTQPQMKLKQAEENL